MSVKAMDRRSFLAASGAALAVAGVAGIALADEPAEGEAPEGEAPEGEMAEGEMPEGMGDMGGMGGGDTTTDEHFNGDRPDYPWDPEPPTITDDMVEEEVEADVIVVGAGIAGCAAIRSAAEEGVSVIFFEKTGSTTSSGHQMAIIDSSANEVWNRYGILDRDEIVDHEMDEGGYFAKRTIYRDWFEGIGGVFDWYMAADPDFYVCKDMYDVPPEGANSACPMYCPLPEAYDFKEERYPTYPSSATVSTDELNELGVQSVIDNYGVVPYYYHAGSQLIKDDSGRVTGIYAYNYDTGMYKKATAHKGVVLATGDFAGNDEFVKYFLPEQYYNKNSRMSMNYDPDGESVERGDALVMGDWIGAKLQQHPALMIHHMGSSPLQCTPFLQLNKYGERFMNEDVPGQQIENQIELQKDFTSYLVFDANYGEHIPAMPAAHAVKCFFLNDDETDVIDGIVESEAFVYPAQVQSAVDSGRLATADTLEELYAQLDIDVDAALATTERYNEFCAAGKDDDFGKTPGRLFPIDTPPFYAETLNLASSLVCLSGIESDEQCRTYDTERNIIPGLFVAGNCQGNRVTVQYPIAFCGMASSLALFYGYTAGKSAANAE